MKEYIKRRLREDLEYHHVSDATKDEYVIDEDINMLSFKLPQKVKLTDEDKTNIQNLKFDELDFEQLNETSPVDLRVILPWENDIEKGIVLSLQVINDTIYQIHIDLDRALRGQGLGFKIYKALINTFGHLYSGKKRRHNLTEVPAIWRKLGSESGITCHSNENMDVCILDANPDKEKLKKILNIS